jgi:hypothetical protein
MLRKHYKNIGVKMRFGIQLVFLFVLLASPELVIAATSTSYQIDPSGTDGVFHVSTSTSYKLEGAIEPITGLSTSTNYRLESGSSFPGLCGDGFIDPSEDCEGSNLNSRTCITQGFTGGSLSCSSACTFNTSSCTSGSTGGGGGGGGGGIALSSPTFDNVFMKKSFTYKSELLFYGYKPSDARDVYFNGSTSGVSYPTVNKWSKKSALKMGKNTIVIYAANVSLQSSPSNYTITRRLIGDINLDGKVNDYDFSLLANHWSWSWPEGDFNEDGRIDDYDLSMLVAYWAD